MNLYEVIKRPLITEKAAQQQGFGQYAFEVDRRATKPMIREAVETCFKVKVAAVHTQNIAGKQRSSLRGRRYVSLGSSWKKAVVTLADGETLELFEGV